MSQPVDLLLRNCCVIFPDRPAEILDIAIADGQFMAIAPQLPHSALREIDLQGLMVTPPFVESHIHLDSALTLGDPRRNQSGTLFEGINIWRDRKQSLTIDDIKQRAIATLKQQAMQGVLFVRTHADVSESQLIALKGLLEVREQVKDWITLQVVAFPQDGLYGQPHNQELMEEALKLGADAVGGIPHYELTREDGVQSIHRIFELAERFDRLIDVHCDEIDDDQARFLEVIVACAIRSGLGDRVTASHTTAFASYNNAYALKLMGFLQRTPINFVSNPLINITLQGRTDTYPKRRGITRVKELWQLGQNVSLGHDCIQDPWYALGTGSMLDVANMAVHVCQMTGTAETDACYNMTTWNGAKTLHIESQYGIEIGKPANLVVLDVDSAHTAPSELRYEAIRCRPAVRWVIARGQVLVESTPARTTWNGVK